MTNMKDETPTPNDSPAPDNGPSTPIPNYVPFINRGDLQRTPDGSAPVSSTLRSESATEDGGAATSEVPTAPEGSRATQSNGPLTPALSPSEGETE